MEERIERPYRVAVVGGGFAGLAAGIRLARAGASVTVFERSGRLGGLAMTLPFGGTEIEKYYHHWFTSDLDALGLVRELGFADRLRWASPVMGMFRAGSVHRFTSPGDLLRFRPLSAVGKARFALVTAFLQQAPRRERFEGVTAAAWLRRAAGREVYETIWGPLLRAKFGRRAGDVSMAWIWSKLRLRGRSRRGGGTRESLAYLDGGFGQLAEAMGGEIRRHGGEIRRPERVGRIARDAAGTYEVETPRRRERFDGVVSTVAPPLLATLAPRLPDDYRRRCQEIDHAAILCSLYVLRQRFSPIYWMNVSDETVPFGGLIEHTNFVPPAHYGDRHLLYVSHYVYPDDPVYQMDAEALFRHYRPALARIRSGVPEEAFEHRMTFRDRFAQPIVTADYHERLLPLATPWPGLVTATMAQVYPEDRGTNYAVRIGRAAAGELLAHARAAAAPRAADHPHERRRTSA